MRRALVAHPFGKLRAGLKVLGYVALTVLAGAGLLWTSATPAHACSCALPIDEAAARTLLEESDLVVAGAVAARGADSVEIDVESVYKGASDSRVVVKQPASFSGQYPEAVAFDTPVESIGPDCSYTILGPLGERYLLTLSARSGEYAAAGCSSFSFRLAGRDDYYARSLQALEAVAKPVSPPIDTGPASESGDGDFPYAPVAGGAAVGALAFLAAAFVWRRKG